MTRSNFRGIGLKALAGALSLAAFSGSFVSSAAAEAPVGIAKPGQMGFQTAVTSLAEEIHSFHDLLLWMCVIISLFVLALLIYVMVRFNEKASGCTKYGFDGAAILYGTGNHFYLLTEASSMDPSECTATALVMGVQAWANLVDSGVAALGCENID